MPSTPTRSTQSSPQPASRSLRRLSWRRERTRSASGGSPARGASAPTASSSPADGSAPHAQRIRRPLQHPPAAPDPQPQTTRRQDPSRGCRRQHPRPKTRPARRPDPRARRPCALPPSAGMGCQPDDPQRAERGVPAWAPCPEPSTAGEGSDYVGGKNVYDMDDIRRLLEVARERRNRPEGAVTSLPLEPAVEAPSRLAPLLGSRRQKGPPSFPYARPPGRAAPESLVPELTASGAGGHMRTGRGFCVKDWGQWRRVDAPGESGPVCRVVDNLGRRCLPRIARRDS